ncbi:MAG: Maf family nucleotide pyrophosphatase [Magnetospirillum sp. WYHS-4]
MVTPLVLASASAVRATILRHAGLEFEIRPADVDEAAIKADLAERSTSDLAARLAETKARRTAERHPGALVIGADQILDCGGRRFDKPRDRTEARRHLEFLRGRDHRLVSAVCAARDDELLWEHRAEPVLTMRSFSDEFLNAYLDRAGPDVLDSVGAYRLEGIGVQLFSRIDGDYFSILGLPLLPLLDFLRRHGVLSS